MHRAAEDRSVAPSVAEAAVGVLLVVVDAATRQDALLYICAWSRSYGLGYPGLMGNDEKCNGRLRSVTLKSQCSNHTYPSWCFYLAEGESMARQFR